VAGTSVGPGPATGTSRQPRRRNANKQYLVRRAISRTLDVHVSQVIIYRANELR
jgi:hypothetical protein